MDSKKTPNRYHLACKFCLKVTGTLPNHLRRACMKHADNQEIEFVMQEARGKMRAILEGLSIVNYEDLDYEDSDPKQFFVQFLEKNGCYIRGKLESASCAMKESILPSNMDRNKVNVNWPADEVGETQAPCKDLDLSHKMISPSPLNAENGQKQQPTLQSLQESIDFLMSQLAKKHEKVNSRPLNAEAVQKKRPVVQQGLPIESDEEDYVSLVNEQEVEMQGPELDLPIESDEENFISPVNEQEVEMQGPELDLPVESEENNADPLLDDNDDDDYDDDDKENEEMETHNLVEGLEQTETNSNYILLRRRMMAAGMYRKHSLECGVLARFRKYLQQELQVTRWSQEVANVARFLYFVDPSKASLSFLTDTQKTLDFFTALEKLGNTHATMFSYLKHIKRFVRSQTDTLSSGSHQSEDLAGKCKRYLDMTATLQRRLSKGITARVVGKKFDYLTSAKKDPSECQRILVVARPIFDQIIKKAKMGVCLLEKEKSYVIYYLEALIVLKYLQRPGVVQNMTVEEWCKRMPSDCKTRMVIGVKRHKTSTQQVASILLEEEEEEWFDVYYKKIRPSFIRSGKCPQTFFISSTGEPIHSVTNDIARLHHKFKLRPVTSQEARRTMETYMVSHFQTDAQRNMFARLLGHSNVTAGRIYGEKTVDNMVEAAEMMKRAMHESQPSTSRCQEVPQKPLQEETPEVSRGLREEALKNFKPAS
eukprot:XP_002944957.2 PREDICTED: uncharacterized protein menf.2 [Xenopus tropicalis]